MIITPIDHSLDYIGKSKSGASRGKATHISDLYNSLFKQLEPKKYSSDTPLNPLHLEMGLAWEDMLEDGLKERMQAVAGEDIERPGEMVTTTGIYYNPDLLIYSDSGTRLGEIKLTWMSGREMPTTVDYALPKKFQKYNVQMMAYCYWLGLLDARLYVFFVNGDYSWMQKRKGAQGVLPNAAPIGPVLRAYDIRYSQQELDDNWQMLEQHGKHAGLLDAHGNAVSHD